jgi:lipoate-protein ligase A
VETWRYIVDDGVTASIGLAADEFLLRAAAQGGPTALRLYTYKPYAALVGRFQNVEAELQLDECQLLGADINRRLTGGGAIIMGDSQLGLALAVPPKETPRTHNPALLFQRYAGPIIDGLRALGVAACFRPKNDIEVGGKKIAGLGLYADEEGGLLFHTSILVDLDVPLMLRLLNLAPEKISDKHIASFEDRLTTVRRVAGDRITVEEVRQAVRSAFEQDRGVRLEPVPFTPEEIAAIRGIEERRYRNPDWIFQRTPPLDARGSSVCKTEAGLLRVYVSLAGWVLKSVLITGDFFGDRQALRDLEARLKWSSGAPDSVRRTVEEAWSEAPRGPIWGLSPAALTEVILAAIADARRSAGLPQEAVTDA